MRKFRFKLEAVLTHRKRREDDVLAMLAKSQRALQFEKDRKTGTESDLARALLRRESLGSTATGIQAFIIENDFILGLKQRLGQIEHAILRANRGVEKALRVYLFAKRQTRMIETLREKAAIEFRQTESKREQRALDEMVIMRHRLKENDDEQDHEEADAVSTGRQAATGHSSVAASGNRGSA